MAREPLLMACCGKKGVGKSYQHVILMNQYVQGDYYKGIRGRKCLIMDVNDEYGYGTYNYKAISLKDIALLISNKTIDNIISIKNINTRVNVWSVGTPLVSEDTIKYKYLFNYKGILYESR
jgi:hypothetical protein